MAAVLARWKKLSLVVIPARRVVRRRSPPSLRAPVPTTQFLSLVHPYRRSVLRPPAQEQLVGKSVVILTHIGMTGPGAPELRGLGGDSLREKLPQLTCFSAIGEKYSWGGGCRGNQCNIYGC